MVIVAVSFQQKALRQKDVCLKSYLTALTSSPWSPLSVLMGTYQEAYISKAAKITTS